MRTFLLILLLVFICSAAGSSTDGTKSKVELANPYEMKVRKLMGVAMLDYHDPGANPVHDPGKGKSGGRGGNP